MVDETPNEPANPAIEQRSLLLNSGLSLVARLLGGVSAFLLTLFLGRYLGADESGLYFLGFSVVTLLSVTSRMGTDNTVLRITSTAFSDNDRGLAKSVLRRSMLLSTLLGSVFAVALYLFAPLLGEQLFKMKNLDGVFQSMSVAVIGLSWISLISIALQGMRRVATSIFVLNISINITTLLLTLALTSPSAGQVGMLFSLATVATALVGWKLLPAADDSKPGETCRYSRIFASCIPLWGADIMSQTARWSGQLIAGVWITSDQLAQLAAAQRTAMLMSFVLSAVNLVLAPRFASLHHRKDLDGLRAIAGQSSRWLAAGAFPLLVVMMIMPEWIMGLFGSDFIGGAPYLRILAISQYVNVCTGSVGYLLSMTGHEKDLRTSVGISAIAAVSAAFMLIPYYGAYGAALATGGGVVIQNLLCVVQVRRRLGFIPVTARMHSS